MKKKYENLIVGLMTLGMFAFLLWIPSLFTSLPLWVGGLIVVVFTSLWLFACAEQVARYFIDIYKSDGFKGIKKEIIFWLPPLYFVGSVILVFQKGFFEVGIIVFLIGIFYFCIKEYIKTKKLDAFALIYTPPLAIGGLFLFIKILQLLMKIPYFIPIAISGFVLWFMVAALIALKKGK